MIAPEARGVWSEIEARLRPHVARRVASRADVDDILQEIFIRVHETAIRELIDITDPDDSPWLCLQYGRLAGVLNNLSRPNEGDGDVSACPRRSTPYG